MFLQIINAILLYQIVTATSPGYEEIDNFPEIDVLRERVVSNSENRVNLVQRRTTVEGNVSTLETFVNKLKTAKVLVNVQLPNPNNNLEISTGALVFNKVIHNTDNAYDETSGHFRAPVSGIYLISVKICIRKENALTLNIMKNTALFSRSVLNSAYDDCCLTVVEAADLNALDVIRIQISEPSYFAREGVGNSNFIVVLLKIK